MTTLRMETEVVQNVARQLKQANVTASESIAELRTSIQGMLWEGPGAEEFHAEFDALARQLEVLFEQGTILGERVEREVAEWLGIDGRGAAQFQDFHKANPYPTIVKIMAGGGVLLASAQVLGTSTSSYTQEYRQMSWNQKFKEEQTIKTQITEQQKSLQEMKSEDELYSEINSIDEQIAKLERQKAEAQANADIWYNKIIPDLPLKGDNDGAPWRVRTDDYEDQIAGYDRQLKALQEQKQAAQAELDARLQAQANLTALQTRQNALAIEIDRGVPVDGPTKPAWLKNQLAGCTNYVAEKRDVSSFPNSQGEAGHPLDANMWDNQAKDAGFDVGSRPVKGSIMVFEGKNDVMSVNKTAGHVAYVENVKAVAGGYEVTISQADTKYDAGGNFIRGTYTNKRTSTIVVKDGSRGVSFIYDKP